MKRLSSVATVVAVTCVALLVPSRAAAHCDTLDGPVVKAAQRALDEGDVAFALIWVAREDEREVRAAFAAAREVRRLGPSAQALADRYFFETVVRLHRAGEGEPYTGIEPAGHDLGPAISLADRALETGLLAPLTRLLSTAVQTGLDARFNAAIAARKGALPGDVEAGRAYVKAYVEFIHYAERLHEAAATVTHGHDVDESAAR